jgi:hypothetical protein
MLTFPFTSTSAPFVSSIAPTTSKWPFWQAIRSDVHPPCGAGEHRSQRLPPPSSRGPPACPHHHTASVALKPGLFTRLPPGPRLPRAPLPACAAATASTRRRRRRRRCRRPLSLESACACDSARARVTARYSLLCRSDPLARCSACPSIRRSKPSPCHYPHIDLAFRPIASELYIRMSCIYVAVECIGMHHHMNATTCAGSVTHTPRPKKEIARRRQG